MSDVFSKVLFVGPLNPYGGIGAVLRTYEQNIEPFNFIATHKDQSKLGSICYFIVSLMKINATLLCNRKIQIVHIHSASKGSFVRKTIISLLAKSWNKKVVFHMHGGQIKDFYNQLSWSKYFFKKVIKGIDLFICLTEEWKSYFEIHFGLEHILVLGNPVPIANNILHKPFKQVISLLFLGSINPKKGIYDLLNYLYANPYFQNKQIQLTIGGIGEVDKLFHLIQQPEALNQIQYIGFVEGQVKNDVIQHCDFFILPSYYEGLPVSILEAMGFGKPIIATRVGGIPSVVKEHRNGWLFDAGDFKQLDPIFDEILNQQFPLHQYQQNAYEMASDYSSEKIMSHLALHFKNLINE